MYMKKLYVVCASAVTNILLSSRLSQTNPFLTYISGVARGGRGGGDRPLVETLPPRPNEITLCTGLWRAAILSPSQPPCSLLSPLAAPSF